MRPTRAFTLIELLIVIAIVSILSGLAMPMIVMAREAANETATRAVMAKVDVAARLFREDVGPYPYQASYADLAAGEAWTNRLGYHLGTTIDPDDYDDLVADADEAAARYDDSRDPNSWSGNQGGGSADGMNVGTIMLNRMGAERARLAIFSGNWDYRGPRSPSSTLVVAPRSEDRPGWAGDYLQGELEPRYLDGDAILDSWGRPLIYVCQVVEGMRHAHARGSGTSWSLEPEAFGLQPEGRTTLALRDPRTGQALRTHSTYLPDLTRLKHSDRRFYAAPGLELEFELWSAGADGRAEWMRDAAVNRDNVSPLPYDEEL